MILKRLAAWRLAAFDRRYGYDGGYLRRLLDEGGLGALGPARALAAIGRYRRDVPASVYYAAKLTAATAADCGPCAQLMLAMAAEDGVPASVLRAIVAGDRAVLGETERLALDLARATIDRRDANPEREELRRRFGTRGVASIAYGIVAAQGFPALKYALGAAHACERLVVAGESVVPSHA